MKRVNVVVVSLFMSKNNIMNYFEQFNLPIQFELDLALLEQQYLSLQLECHPDQHKHKNNVHSLHNIMEINQAYEILKSDLKRAEYLLELENIAVNKESGGVKPSQEILLANLNAREELSNCSDLDQIQKMYDEIYQQRKIIVKNISSSFKARNLPEAAQQTIALKYTEKLLSEIKTKKQELEHAIN